MTNRLNRRQVLKGIGTACAAAVLPPPFAIQQTSGSPGISAQTTQIAITSVSQHTIRLTISPIQDGRPAGIPDNGCLVRSNWGAPTTITSPFHEKSVKVGTFTIDVSPNPLAFAIKSGDGNTIQQLNLDDATRAVSFLTGDSPLLGLGEGGPQFDRRGSTDAMHSGQGGYKLGTNGGRVPIPWIIGTSGWAIFFNQPFGTFDFTGAESKFLPAATESAVPLDIFIVASPEPATIMAEYARLTGHPEMPPLWSFGFQQSHRTLGTPEEILAEVKTFREKKLPCDTMIYLGTGFCPNGWNTENGSFVWNTRAFPDPKKMIDDLHADHFKVIPHVVILSNRLHGTAHDPCELRDFNEASASCYWDMHRRDFALGVDGWWPDEGDPLDTASRLVRNRMYWEGPQIDRPNQRPFALHRNGYAGMQRYASFLWSGDVYSTWETLKTHIPDAINTALSGIPYWGTDIGGFVPTKEFTAELYLRWFQFGSFCTLFRCHGRTWKLRLPWGWDTGDPGPIEIRNYDGASVPDASQLHNAQVEPICKKYLELRYRMLPYLYSAVRECALTGMPVMRGLWLHYPDDPTATARPDEFLWGRDILVAPVVEQGATSRSIYLPRGTWYDFWTNERVDGGREITRPVDLETLPLYVRAGAIIPMDPVRQYVSEKVENLLTVSIYPGADGEFHLYEDDGESFNYRKGEWMGIDMRWSSAARKLSLHLAESSRMLQPGRQVKVEVIGGNKSPQTVTFKGQPLNISL